MTIICLRDVSVLSALPAGISRSVVTAGLLMLVLSSGCSSDLQENASVPPVPVASVEATADAVDDESADGSGHRHYTGIGFEIPEDWQEIPNQTMVDSKFLIPSEHGEMEITLTSMGGGIQANLDRWVGQVGREPGDEPGWSTVDVAGIEARMVDVRGSFNSTVGSNPGAKEDWRLIGIAIPLPRDFFVKLVGPREAVVEFQDELDAFLKTAHLDH